VHPALIAAFERGTLARDFAPRGHRARGLAAEERALLAFLRRAGGKQSRSRRSRSPQRARSTPNSSG
jgi:hypothetical protein